MTAPNPLALAAYRHLLRATGLTFRGDFPLLLSARSRARAEFDSKSTLDSESQEALRQIRHAEEVAVVLRRNVVQGEKEAVGEEKGEGGEGRWRECYLFFRFLRG
ncbi:Mitochondrial zinc maintenance protein 1, mitochondrial [Thelotrema lepadinum]|nr:Mitochondrial zinc maintenance protein 1, mitochondrial [Thelotrema lepadinum]